MYRVSNPGCNAMMSDNVKKRVDPTRTNMLRSWFGANEPCVSKKRKLYIY
jgi:hypothetical protein